MKIKMFVLFALVLVAGCAHEQTVDQAGREANGLPEKSITVLFSANRHSELEPCGCSLNPTGGAEREFNYLAKVKAETGGTVLNFSAGTTFLPEEQTFTSKLSKYYQKKASFVVKALNQLSLKALSPSANDFKLGVAELKKLEAASEFKWVLSNVVEAKTQKPVFANHLLFKEGADEYLVLGLTAKPLKKFETNEVKVLPPQQVLTEILGDARFAGKFVIVLSDLPKKEWEQMGALTSRVRLVLGGDSSFVTASDWLLMGTSTVFANPPVRTKSYARLDLKWIEPIIGFYSEKFQSGREFEKRALELKLYEAKAKLGEKLSKKQKAEWTSRLALAEKAFSEFQEFPTSRVAGMAQTESVVAALDDKFAGTNALTALVSEWQAEVRNIAVGER